MEKLRILCIEDSIADAEITERELRRSGLQFTIEFVDAKENYVNALKNYKPGLVISDHSLYQFNSVEALELLKESRLNIPFILLTGTVSEEFAVRILKMGADDYVLKSNYARLPAAIENALNKKNAELEKKKSLQKLEASEKKYRQLFESNPMPMWILDESNFRFLNVNEAAIKHYGYSREEFMQMTAVDLRPDSEKQRFLDLKIDTGIGSHSIGMWHHKKKDGTVINVEITIDQVNYNEQKGLLVLANDITEKIKIYQALKTKNEQLEKVNAELDRFVYSASHELRAPISTMLGLIGLIEHSAPGKDSAQVVEMMKSRLERLDNVIRDILDYSQNSRMELVSEPIDLKKLIDHCFTSIDYLNTIDKIRFQVEIEEELSFCTDRKRLQVVIGNLLSNAFKYHNLSQSDPYVKISSTRNGETVLLTVTDNGSGISPDYLDKIFNMYFRGTNTPEGTGLGLYIVKEIINTMGGNIEVQSELRKGSTFRIRLPDMCFEKK
jgi:PAS domain S-box-containing protein